MTSPARLPKLANRPPQSEFKALRRMNVVVDLWLTSLEQQAEHRRTHPQTNHGSFNAKHPRWPHGGHLGGKFRRK